MQRTATSEELEPHRENAELRMLTIQQLSDLTGMSKTTLYRFMTTSGFPHPVKLGDRSVRWFAHEVATWLKNQPRTTQVGNGNGGRKHNEDE